MHLCLVPIPKSAFQS